MNVNNNISLALYKEILNDWENVPVNLNEEQIEDALNVSLPCRLELVSPEIIKKFASDLDLNSNTLIESSPTISKPPVYKTIWLKLIDFHPVATYLDTAQTALGIRSLIKTIRTIHSSDRKLKIYLIASLIGPWDEVPYPLINSMCMNSDDVKLVVFEKLRLMTLKQAENIVKKIKSSGMYKQSD